jgi:hypothetical protein
VAGLGLDVLPLRDVLGLWRRENAPVRMVLPVPGDMRGVPGPVEFRDAAIEAGEAVIAGSLGLVPEITEYYPSSARTTVEWQCFVVEPVTVEYLPLTDVQFELTSAIRDCASALLAADVAGGPAGVGEGLRDARRAGERLNLPPGFPSRAVALLAQAERMRAALDLAAQDPTGGAVDRFAMSARDGALRPLETAVRRARLAAYNAGSDVRP